MSIRFFQASLPIFLLLAGTGFALHASSGQTGESASSSARLFRNSDLHIELDSKGKGRLDASGLSAADSALQKSNQTATPGPQVKNGGFEEGSITDNYQYARKIPGWTKLGSGAMFVRSGAAAFKKVKASHGKYLMALMGQGSGVYQSVPGHTVGAWYRLMFRSGYRNSHGEAKLKVSVDATEKFNQAVYAGNLGWYEVTYKAPYPDVVISFEHSGPKGDNTVYLDSIDIQPVELWDMAHGNSRTVLLQKVTCNGYPSPDKCTRGHFLSVADYDQDGKTSVLETSAATESSVWVALHQGNRWSFKSVNLNQPSPSDGNGPARSGDMWYLHSDYNTCQARNWFSHATATFDVVMNGMKLHQVSDVGTECGSLFAIQKFEHAQTITAR